MRVTVTLDDALLALAHDMSGIDNRRALLHEGLTLIVQREAARRLVALGGSSPGLRLPRRRRSALAPVEAEPTPAPAKTPAKPTR